MDFPSIHSLFLTGLALIAVYILQKILSPKMHLFPKNMFWILFIVAVLLLPIAIVLTVCFSVYRQIIHAILKTKHGSQFDGMLSGKDALFAMEAYKNQATNSAIVIQCNRKSPTEFYDFASKAILDNVKKVFGKHSPTFGHLCCFGGYYYILKNAIGVEDCIGKLHTIGNPTSTMDKNKLFAVLGKCFNRPLPRNHQALWEVLIGAQPVDLKEVSRDGAVFYPIVFRCNHSASDAIRMITFVGESFRVEETLAKANRLGPTSKERKSNPNGTLWTKFKFYLTQLYYIYTVSAKVLMHLLPFEKRNLLHGSTLSYKEVFVQKTVEAAPFIQKIKNIKRQVAGSSFMDVVLAAYSYSLSRYLKKRSGSSPKYITIAMPELPVVSRGPGTAAEALTRPSFECGNNLAFSIIRLPICTNQNKTQPSLLEVVKKVQQEVQFFRNSKELEVNKMLIGTFFCYYPRIITSFVMQLIGITGIISNIIAPPVFKLPEDCAIEIIWGFAPLRENTGLCMTLLSYNNKMMLTLTADKALVDGEDEAVSILTGVCEYLDLTNDECTANANKTQ